MKKAVVTIAASIIITGAAATSASAAEYEVQKGDNLWEIADDNNTTVDELMNINQLKTTIVYPEQKLLVNNIHVVEQGDTLTSIAKKYDVKVNEVKKWNNLSSDLIIIGQELEIKGANISKEIQKPQEEKTVEAKSETKTNENETTVPAQEQEQVSTPETETSKDSSDKPDGQTFTVTATAYTAKCDGCSGVTATGVNLNANPNAKVIAVDPSVIPLGSQVYVEGYGYATAADTGGAIKGNKIDVHVPSKDEARSWGVRTVNVTVIGK